ncbi:unnamed protein product, partial [Prorocentrum cordatum]
GSQAPAGDEDDAFPTSGHEEAVDVLRRMRMSGAPPRGGGGPAASSAAPGTEPCLLTYNNAIAVCKKAGQLEAGRAVLADMRRRGVAPDLYTYTALVAACGEGQWQLAVGLLAELQGNDLAPNAVAHGALCGALEKSHQWQRALSVLFSGALRPTVVTFGAAMGACEK